MPKDPKYLSDPDESHESSGISSELVKAVTRDDAEEVCNDLANEYDVELIDVEHRGSTWWDCIFGGEQR